MSSEAKGKEWDDAEHIGSVEIDDAPSSNTKKKCPKLPRNLRTRQRAFFPELELLDLHEFAGMYSVQKSLVSTFE